MCTSLSSKGQNRYKVFLKDKSGSEYNPFEYLHPKAIERRMLHGLDLCDISDFPVSPKYLIKIKEYSDSIHGVSRWFNAIFIETDDQRIKEIGDLSFVQKIEPYYNITQSAAASYNQLTNTEGFDTVISGGDKELVLAQLERMGGQALKDSGLDGKGVIICIIDVGFSSYKSNPAFKHMRNRNGILKTYDFVKKRENTDIGLTHGTTVLSCLGGIAGPYQIGLATGADYLLARTENITEFFKEEVNWLMAAEWADKNGASIINSSLGYTIQRYLPEQMDGKTAFVSKAAQKAVDKGILVVSSAGNEGNGPWKRVAAPGDAAGVLTVGGTNPKTGIHIYFSSYGPSWDRRLKPEVSAYGRVLASTRYRLDVEEGTSFSSPLVAGFAACLKQRFPKLTNIELKEKICRSGDLWPYYDYAHGYGVPQPYFLYKDTIENNPTVEVREDSNGVNIYPIKIIETVKKEIDSSLIGKKRYLMDSAGVLIPINIEMKDSLTYVIKKKHVKFSNQFNTSTPDYFYYHIKNRKGYLDKYYVLDFEDSENKNIYILKDITDKPFSIEFFYKGYYKELLIKE